MTGLEKWNKTENASQTIEEAVDTIMRRGNTKEFCPCDWCVYSGYCCGGTSCETGIELYLEGEVGE